MKDREPTLVQLLELLATLPRFDPSKPASALQGDIPGVQEAERLYHSFNTRYQERKTVTDKNGEPKSVAVRAPLLVELFKLADWQNLQKLISHSTVGRERKKRSNEKQRIKQKQDNPKAWFEGCSKKRRDRLKAWEDENHPRLLRMLAEAEQASQLKDKATSARIQYEVLNELEARYVDEDRTWFEFKKMEWRILLGIHTQTQLAVVGRRLEKLARVLWEDPEARLKEDLARRLPPIITDWDLLEQAIDQGNLAANGESPAS
jgi:hypothetical protein